MLPLRGRTQVPHAVCVRRSLNKFLCDRLERERRHAGLLLQLIQQRVSGSVRRCRVGRALWLVLSGTLKAMGRSFLTSTGHGAEGLRVCSGQLLCLFFWRVRRAPSEHRLEASRIQFSEIRWFSPAGPLAVSCFRPRQQSGETLFPCGTGELSPSGQRYQ